METLQKDTAILLFARIAGEEVLCKPQWEQQGQTESGRVTDALLHHTVFVAKGSDIPLVAIDSERHTGANTGERLSNAMQEVFSAGYQRVICIGADCPSLTSADLTQAHDALRHHRVVVGPTAGGGAYLLGLHINSFDPETLAMLSWQTDELLSELVLYSYRMGAGMGRLAMLEQKANVGADLSLYLRPTPLCSPL